MAYQPNPKQALFLWRLITSEEGQAQGVGWSKTRPALPKSEKQELVDRGFLHLERRGRSQFLTPADQAWAWAAGATDVKLARSSSPVGAEALEALLHRLLPFLRNRDIGLAELFSSPESEGKANGHAVRDQPSAIARSAAGGDGKLPDRIEKACLSLAGGARKERVRLSALRQALGDVERHAVDRALLDMQDGGKLVLYRDDNAGSLTADDHQAALSINGAPRHLVLLEA